jgi:ABC-type multidrug transport system permease subunit
MTTGWDKLGPDETPAPPARAFHYLLAMACGAFAGWMDIKVGDLLFTALLVLASCMLLGVLRPQKPWRWVVLVGAFVPLADLLAYLLMTQKPYRAQIYESLLAFLPGIAGAYGGSVLRGVVDTLLAK